MRVLVLVVAAALLTTACHSKSSSSSGSAGSAETTAQAGSAAQGSAGSAASSAVGSAAAPDPRIAALSPEERRTCGIYATCKVTGLRDDDPQADEKRPQFLNECLAAWVNVPATEKKKIAECADAVGACFGPPPCFDSMKLNP